MTCGIWPVAWDSFITFRHDNESSLHPYVIKFLFVTTYLSLNTRLKKIPMSILKLAGIRGYLRKFQKIYFIIF